MLFFLALFATYTHAEWTCIEGRGLCDKRILMSGRPLTALACTLLVQTNEPTADGATWMKRSRKCWAEIGHFDVRSTGASDRRYTHCSLGADPTEAPEPEPVVETVPPIVKPPPAPVVELVEPVILNEPVEKPTLDVTFKEVGSGGCSCQGKLFCRVGYKQFDLNLDECKAKAIELGAKGMEYGASDHSCMTVMAVPDGTNHWAGVTCYEVVIPTTTLPPVVKPPPAPPAPVESIATVELNEPVEKPALPMSWKTKGKGGCSCKGELYCRTGYKQWDLDLDACREKAASLGAKAFEYGAKDHTCMTHMSAPTGSNLYPGVTCYEAVPPTYSLVKKADGGCSCAGEKYCRTGYKQFDVGSLDECKAKGVELGAKGIEFGAKDHLCMTHMSEPTGGNGYPGVTCYDLVLDDILPAAQQAFATSGSQGPGLLVQGFAALGLGVMLYGAGKHYLGK